ncbi:PREDICTED: uncharacterized protein LOC109127154 [Camelina sativa]|uniref:Uncharacterized protein LOC109127154 n=1 Tax=Camelina sativa TaxID=90675 RepID=A0ABM1QJS4_CAMSA|nr:PREDICTED: uncharacterized protein LOC109127154 [Camelina sativa]
MGKKGSTTGEGRKGGSTPPASKNEVDNSEAKVESPNRASQKEKAKRASSSQPSPVPSKRSSPESTPTGKETTPKSKKKRAKVPHQEKKDESASASSSQPSPVPSKRSSPESTPTGKETAPISSGEGPKAKLDKYQRRNNIWWDYDNKEVPTDLEHNQVYNRMQNALQAIGFHGPIKIRAFVKNICLIFSGPTDRPTTDNQAADESMKREIKKFLKDDSHSPGLENHLFISSDKGFSENLKILMEAGYVVMNLSEGRENLGGLEYKWDNWRLFLGLSKQRVYKNPNAKKEAISKKNKSKIKRKERRKKAVEARKRLIANAEDEKSEIPSSISERDGGRVEMKVKLVIHTQKPVVIDINNDSVEIVVANAADLHQFICNRLKSPIEDITFEEPNRVVVANKSMREIYVAMNLL